MTKETSLNIRRIYNILLSISIVFAGICLIIGCLSIYYSGEQPYSPESVAETFSTYSIPIYFCILLMAISFIWEFCCPYKYILRKPQKAYGSILQNLSSKKDLQNCSEDMLSSIKLEQRMRKTHALVRTVLIFISTIVFGVYALNGANFHQSEINASMIKAMTVLIPCLIVPFVYAVYTVYYNEKSYKREIELLKKLPGKTALQDESSKDISNNKEKILQYVLLGAALFLIIFGYASGGFADVMTKAINICTECIGLG